MGKAIKKPANSSITVRRMDFVFDEKVPRYWVGKSPYLTHTLNALTATFPAGERFLWTAYASSAITLKTRSSNKR